MPLLVMHFLNSLDENCDPLSDTVHSAVAEDCTQHFYGCSGRSFRHNSHFWPASCSINHDENCFDVDWASKIYMNTMPWLGRDRPCSLLWNSSKALKWIFFTHKCQPYLNYSVKRSLYRLCNEITLLLGIRSSYMHDLC